MNIFFLITGLGAGGAERQVVDLSEQLAASGRKIYICYITGEAKILPSNKKIQIIPLNAKKNPWSLLKALFSLRKIIRKIKPDIIHSHMVHANLMARIVRPLLGIKTVLICTAHNKNEGGKLRMLAYRLTDFLANISTNVSEEAVDAFIAKKATKRGRMIAMHNGIDTDKFLFDKNEREKLRVEQQILKHTKVLIAVGRITEAKDYPNLLQAYSKLKEIDTVLWIVGDGDKNYKYFLEKMVDELGIRDRVFFLGLRNDISALLSAADIFILSSEWEGFGLVVAEAMSCERVVVATDSGGVKEVLGDCGFLVPIKQPEILSKNIKEALSLTKKEAEILGKKARERVLKNFDLKYIAKQWSELYSKLLYEPIL
ncbi:MAG: glycosyltransferase [Campylobacteraceae bacterium]|jgi:glycosyltransferase involved in cell wall biosynthesis|nr:glycosyltransferase [Campylobacteraceae bacterium]